jgi:outer membrane biosynthesis protein TonB
MSEEAWPTPREPSREPLPRVEDLPIADQGYEQESVRAAFDSFYRHAAQLDAALRTLEAVDSFHRQAAALRSDLRALRSAGWTQQSWNVTPAYGYGGRAPREGVSPAVWRIAGEAAFLIVTAVILGVAKLDWWLIVLVMAAALTIVLLIEWAAGRDGYAPPRAAPAPPPVVEGEAVGEATAEEDSLGWTAFEEAQEPSDAMTMVGAPPVAEEPEPEPAAAEADAEPEPAAEAAEPVAETPESEAPEPESDAEPEPELEPAAEAEPEAAVEPEAEAERPRKRWWRRSDGDDESAEEPSGHEPPRHVRVIEQDTAPVETDADPWERGFDEAAVDERTDEDAVAALDEDTDERPPPVAVDGEEPSRKRFRRR